MDLDLIFSSKMFNEVYGDDPDTLSYQKERIGSAIKGFEEHFGDSSDIRLFSAAGRSEIGGNHTDHQRGQVLAASLNIDSIAVAKTVEGNTATVFSE